MRKSRQQGEYATGVHEFPAEVQSLLKVSARYFGLAGVPREMLCRHDYSIAGKGTEWIENQGVMKRGAV